MSSRWTELLEARARAEAADRKLAQTLGALRHRLSPETLALEGRMAVKERAETAIASARHAAEDGARIVVDNPVRTAIAITGLVAFLARNKIAGAVKRISTKSNK